MIRLVVRRKLPYKNQLTPSPRRQAWLRFVGLKRVWSREIPPLLKKERALGPRSLLITRLMGAGERRFDTANLIYSCAILIDLLTQAGYFVNDSEVWLDLRKPVQRRAMAREPAPATIIEIEDLPYNETRVRCPG